MPNFFPPAPAYPTGLDTDYTLFLVYNTSDAALASDNEPYAEEVEVVPVDPDAPEIWPDNGFATISGELFYYDGVDVNDDGKVYRLRRCARGLSGPASTINRAGVCSMVRGFVVAEHHNQLVKTLLRIEDFVGINFDPRVETLDYRIRNLEETPIIFDDWSCPDVTLDVVTLTNSPASGIVIQYDVEIIGAFTTFRLDFGDGTFTTTSQTGTHTYAYNASVSPAVTVSNNQCTMTQSPITRPNPDVPQVPPGPEPFNVTIPHLAPIPTFVCNLDINCGPPEINIPPLVLPCFDLTPSPGITIPGFSGGINIPSFISITPINIPSLVTITPINIPSAITITPISIPSLITIGPAPVIAPIGFGPIPSIAPIDINVDINIDASDIPSCISLGCDGVSITVDWGNTPTLNVALVSGLNTQSAPRRPSFDPELAKELGDDYTSLFDEDGTDSLHVEYEAVGLPSEIRLIAPEFPEIKIVHGIPEEIKLVAPDLPKHIPITVPKDFPSAITINHDLPKQIELVGIDLPSVIRVEHDIPTVIGVRMIDPIPSTIFLDASGIPDSIQVVGVPTTIELKAPESIKLVLEDNIEVPLVYRQGPIDVKVELDMTRVLGTGDGDNPCVMIIPCPRK